MSALQRVLDCLPDARKNGSGWIARCPGHDDHHASLSVSEGTGGKVLLKCHANHGCTAEKIVAAVGLSISDLFEHRSDDSALLGQIVATYDYRGEDSTLLYQTVRLDPKDFRQRRPNGRGGWIWNLKETQRTLYRLPELLASGDELAYVVEGEKDADALAARGLVATSNVGGAEKWRDDYSEALRDRHVVVLPDNDDPGREHAQQVARSLEGMAASVKILALPGLPEKGDVSDWLDADGSAETLAELVAATPAWQLEPEAEARSSPDPMWRPGLLISEAERGQAARGTFVDDYVAYAALRTDAPQAFHEAIALAVLSVTVGRRAVLRLTVGNVYPIIWILILADSTLYRKSTAMDLGEELIRLVEPEFLAPNDFTPQRFVAILAEHDGRPLLFKRDEFSGFYDGLNRLDYMAGLKEVLCDVYDGRPFRREKMKPKARKDEEPKDEEWRYDIREPFLSLAVATTEERFFEVARTNDIHSGFLPRFGMVLPPSQPGPRKKLGEMVLMLERRRTQLGERLHQIVETDIELTCERSVFERFDRYVLDLEEEAQAAPDSNLTAIVGSRISWMAWRMAMLLAVADGTHRMGLPHLLRGIEIAEGWRHNALRVLGSLAPSKFEKRASRLVRLVEQKNGLSRRDAMRALRINKREMDDLQATLSERGEMRVSSRRVPGGTSVWYGSQVSQVSQMSLGPFSTNGRPEAEKGPSDNRDSRDTCTPEAEWEEGAL